MGISMALGGVFLALSAVIFKANIVNGTVSTMMGIIACIAVLTGIEKADENQKYSKVFLFLSQYTMPIFLMHTLFAAPFRALLLKIGVENAAIHVVGGITISFMGPIAAAIFMKKTKILEFFLYPWKYIKLGKKEIQ